MANQAVSNSGGAGVPLRSSADAAERAGNYAEAVKIYQQMESAGGGSAVFARFKLGGYYLMGLGVPRDETTAAAWYAKAIDTGQPPLLAYRTLGMMYLYGAGVPRSEERGRELLQQGGMSNSDPIMRLLNAGMLPKTFDEYRKLDVNAAIARLNAQIGEQKDADELAAQLARAGKPDWVQICASPGFGREVQRCEAFMDQNIRTNTAMQFAFFLEPQKRPAMLDLCAYHLAKHETTDVVGAMIMANHESQLIMDKMVVACHAAR